MKSLLLVLAALSLPMAAQAEEPTGSALAGMDSGIEKIQKNLKDHDKWFQFEAHKITLNEKAQALANLALAEKLSSEIDMRAFRKPLPYGSAYKYSAKDAEDMIAKAKDEVADADYRLSLTQKSYDSLLPERKKLENELAKLNELKNMYLAPQRAAKQAKILKVSGAGAAVAVAAGAYFYLSSDANSAEKTAIIQSNNYARKMDRRPAIAEPVVAEPTSLDAQ